MPKSKLDLYCELESAISKTGADFDRDEQLYMVIVPDGTDRFAYVEVYKNYWIGGIVTYDHSDNSTSYTNVGCPDFYDVNDAVAWLVNR